MLNAFSATYAEARTKFLSLAERRSARLVSREHPSQTGRDGEVLAMDVAVFGDPEAEHSLLIVSGTHGQEGYCGSAIQLAFLDDLDVPQGTNVVALHALNPWGFSHLSRTDENNVDLNRNFHGLSASLPTNPFYAALHPALCPDIWNEVTANWASERDRAIAELGMTNFLTGLTGGQFEIADGLNYGGSQPAWSNRAAAELLPEILANTRKLAFVEWHTGLGRYGELCHICIHDPSSPNYARVFDWFGNEARHTIARAFEGAASATPSYAGPFIAWLPTALRWADCAGLAIEVGTFDNAKVLDALRIDRWLKFGCGSNSQRNELRAVMMERLCPADVIWRRRALESGCNAMKQALAGLVAW